MSTLEVRMQVNVGAETPHLIPPWLRSVQFKVATTCAQKITESYVEGISSSQLCSSDQVLQQPIQFLMNNQTYNETNERNKRANEQKIEWSKTDGRTDWRTDRLTERPIDRPIDRSTDQLTWRTDGTTDQRTDGRMNKRTDERMEVSIQDDFVIAVFSY